MKITILDGKGEGRRVACCNVTLPCPPSLSQPPCSVFPTVVLFVFIILSHLSPLSFWWTLTKRGVMQYKQGI